MTVFAYIVIDLILRSIKKDVLLKLEVKQIMFYPRSKDKQRFFFKTEGNIASGEIFITKCPYVEGKSVILITLLDDGGIQLNKKFGYIPQGLRHIILTNATDVEVRMTCDYLVSDLFLPVASPIYN